MFCLNCGLLIDDHCEDCGTCEQFHCHCGGCVIMGACEEGCDDDDEYDDDEYD